VLFRDLDDLVNGEVCCDWSELPLLADHIGLVGLLPVHGEPVLMTEDGDGAET